MLSFCAYKDDCTAYSEIYVLTMTISTYITIQKGLNLSYLPSIYKDPTLVFMVNKFRKKKTSFSIFS